MSNKICIICRNSKEPISLFAIPKHEIRRQLWIESCGMDFSKYARICHKHFDESDFINGPPGNKKCRLMPRAVPKVKRNNPFSGSNSKSTKVGNFDSQINISMEIDNEPHEDIMIKDEDEISLLDLQFDEQHSKKCGEIVLDTYNNIFQLNCSLCASICLDLITFSEHVRENHSSLIEQCNLVENQIDSFVEPSNIKYEKTPTDIVPNTEEIFDRNYQEIANGETNCFIKVANDNIMNLNEDDEIEMDNTRRIEDVDKDRSNIQESESEEEDERFAVEFDDTNQKSDTDSLKGYDSKIENAELDFNDHKLVAHFIKLLKLKPCIWNTAYAHKKRKEALISLINPISKKFPNLKFTYKNLLILLTTIKTAYRSELKIIKGAENEGIKYVPQLWCFDILKTLETLSDNSERVKQKINDLKKIAIKFPLNIFENANNKSEKITLEIINHYKELPHLWNTNHPDYVSKEYFRKLELKKFFKFLSPKYLQIQRLQQTKFEIALGRMFKWFIAVRDIKLHMEEINKPFDCIYYPRIYRALEFLDGHIPPLRCSICDRIFYVINAYLAHKRNCGNIIHECKECFARFRNSNDLKSHAAYLHSDDRPFACNVCGKTFKGSKYLLQHTRLHEEKQYKCKICENSYRTLFYLREHQKSHLGLRDIVCHVCGKTFTYLRSLYHHRKHNCEASIPKCNICGKGIKPTTTLAKHQKKCLIRLEKKI